MQVSPVLTCLLDSGQPKSFYPKKLEIGGIVEAVAFVLGLWFPQGIAVNRNCLESAASASILLISMWLLGALGGAALGGFGGMMFGGLPGAMLGGLGGAAVGGLLGSGFGYGYPYGYGSPFGYASPYGYGSQYMSPIYQPYSPGMGWGMGQGMGWGMNRGIGWGAFQGQGYMTPYGYSMPLFRYY